jgi:integrase
MERSEAIKSQLVQAVDNDYLPKSPCGGLKKARRGSVARAHSKPLLALTLGEVDEAAKAARSRGVLPATHGDDFLIWFSVATGLRLGEVRALRRGRCHIDDSVARLHWPSLPYVEVVESVTDVHGKGLDADDAPLSVNGQSWGDPRATEPVW